MVTSHVCLQGNPVVFISFYYLEHVSSSSLIPEAAGPETAAMTNVAILFWTRIQWTKKEVKEDVQETLQDVKCVGKQ